MATAKPTKNKINNIKQYLIVFTVVLLTGLSSFLLSKSSSQIYINNEVLHGPHVGPDLSKFIESQNLEKNLTEDLNSDLAAVAKSRSKKQVGSNKTATSTVVTTTTTNGTSTTTTIIGTQTSTTTVAFLVSQDKGMGIAAGGGLVGFSQSALDSYFSNLKNLGITWVRWDIDWSYVQPDGPDIYNWSGTDRIANTAKNYGIKSLAIITYAPRWAGFSTCVISKHCAPADPSVFAHFAGVAVSRYKDLVSAWEIWNEPNLPGFWSPRPDLNAYGNILELSYIQIKKVDPGAFVLSGGLSAAADVPLGSIAPATFVTGLYDGAFNNYFDALALHPYTYPVSPDYIAPWNSWQQMYTVRDVMIEKGESGKKIWITEYGAPTGGPGVERSLDTLSFAYGSDYMSETAQAQMANRSTQIYSQNTSWIGPFFWYSMKDNGTTRNDPENFFGLVHYDGSHKPAYDVIQTFLSTFKIL